MNPNWYVIIIAGGRGERFWPRSRLKQPKHLLPIVGGKPMLTQTIDRLSNLILPENILVITNAEQLDAIRKICPKVPPENIVTEPIGRDTTAAIALSTLLIKEKNKDAVFAVLPADHVIKNSSEFQKSLTSAFKVASSHSYLVTLGIVPTYAATGYGYIKKGKKIEGKEPIFHVEQFIEKPPFEAAEYYVRSGDYLWNTGIFVWKVQTIENALEKFCPELQNTLRKVQEGLHHRKKLEALLKDTYPTLEKVSIDYAVMEKADNVVAIQVNFDWDDVGSWTALEGHLPKDKNGNVSQGKVICENAANNIVISSGGHHVALFGVNNLIVVHTEDATLVCAKEKAQEIKQLLKQIGSSTTYQHLL